MKNWIQIQLYKATATEKKSGKSAEAEWFSSADSAARAAIVNLFDKLTDENGCNCGA